MTGISAVIVNAFLFSIVFLFYLIKTRKISVGGLILSLYAISAIFGIIYYNDPYSNYNNIQLSHYLYYFILFLIICIPIFKFDKLKDFRILYNIKIIKIICRFAFFISIIPLLELLLHLPNLLSSNVNMADVMSELHDERYMGTASNMFYFSTIGAFCYKFVLLLNEVVLIFLFPLIREKKKFRIEITGIIFIILVRSLYAFSVASRASLVWLVVTLVLLVIIFSKSFTQTERKKIYKSVFFVTGGVVAILFIITVARQNGFEDKGRVDYTILTFVSRYIGEGMLNFNQYLFDLKTNTNGDYCFYAIKKMLLLDPFLMDFDNYTSLQIKLGIPMRVFYTFLGFFVIDIGLIGTFLFWSLISFLSWKTMRRFKQVIPLSSLLLVFIYMKIIVTGTNVYSYTWANSGFILFVIFIYIVLRLKKS